MVKYTDSSLRLLAACLRPATSRDFSVPQCCDLQKGIMILASKFLVIFFSRKIGPELTSVCNFFSTIYYEPNQFIYTYNIVINGYLVFHCMSVLRFI